MKISAQRAAEYANMEPFCIPARCQPKRRDLDMPHVGQALHRWLEHNVAGCFTLRGQKGKVFLYLEDGKSCVTCVDDDRSFEVSIDQDGYAEFRPENLDLAMIVEKVLCFVTNDDLVATSDKGYGGLKTHSGDLSHLPTILANRYLSETEFARAWNEMVANDVNNFCRAAQINGLRTEDIQTLFRDNEIYKQEDRFHIDWSTGFPQLLIEPVGYRTNYSKTKYCNKREFMPRASLARIYDSGEKYDLSDVQMFRVIHGEIVQTPEASYALRLDPHSYEKVIRRYGRK